MSAPDPEELARKTLDLWQDQLAALAGDPEAGATMARLMALAAAGPAAALQIFSQAFGGTGNGKSDEAGGRGAAAGATAAAASSQPGEPQLDAIEQRLAAIEQRLAALERAAGATRQGPRARGGKGRSRSPR